MKIKILQRYILQECWLPFLVCTTTLTFIFLAGYLVRAADFIIGRGIPLWDTCYVLMLALPEMFSYTVPMSLLTSVILVFGGLSQNNEIRAMKASGVNPILIMTPAFLAALVLSFFMFVFNDQVATYTSFKVRKVTKEMLIKHPAALIEPGRFVKLSESVVFLTKWRDGNQMGDIVAYENEGPDKPVRTIMAERGEIFSQNKNSELKIKLYDGSVSDSQDASVQSIQFKTYEFPTVGSDDVRLMRKKIREYTLAELLMKSKQKDLSKKDSREVWGSFHQRIAFAFGCFIFAFLGIPIAVLVHRGEVVVSFGISMIATSFYYILFVGAKTISVQTATPAYLAFWIPNVILILIGVKLLRKALVS